MGPGTPVPSGAPTLCPPCGVPSDLPFRLLLPPVLDRGLVSRCLCPVEAPPHPHLSLGGGDGWDWGCPSPPRDPSIPAALPVGAPQRPAPVGKAPGGSRDRPAAPKKLRGSVGGGYRVLHACLGKRRDCKSFRKALRQGLSLFRYGSAASKARENSAEVVFSARILLFFFLILFLNFVLFFFFWRLTVRFCCTPVRNNFVLWESHFYSCDISFIIIIASSKGLAGELGSSPAHFRQVGPLR